MKSETLENPEGVEAALVWSDALLLGHSPMDETHQEFVALVRALQEAQDACLGQALGQVVEHLERHFAQEETWMRTTTYPATDCHVDEHAAVLATARAMPGLLVAGDVAACRRFADELAKWFPGHADYLDAPLAHWLTHQRFKGAPVVVRRRG